jgi:ribose-phosphate pyrophosphokinase
MYPEQDRAVVAIIGALEAAGRITSGPLALIAPYLAYARQDRVSRPGEAVTARALLTTFAALGVTEVFTCDVHNPDIAQGLPVALHNLDVSAPLATAIGQTTDARGLVLAPDEGARERCASLASRLGAGLVVLRKHKRDGTTWFEIDVDDIPALRKADTVIIRDDVTSTGSTLFPLVSKLRDTGVEAEIAYAVTHLLGDHHPLLRRPVAGLRLVASNSVRDALPGGTLFSLADVLAEAIVDRWKI